MARPKSISKLSNDELLNLLEESKQDRAKKTDVYTYIQDCEFKEGKKLLPNSIIYYKYITNSKYKKYNRRAFFSLFGKFFKSTAVSKVRGYRLDCNLVITEEDNNNARMMTRREQYEKVQQKRGRKGSKHQKKETEETQHSQAKPEESGS